MYAVIQTGGKQYRVRPGDLLVVDKLAGKSGDEIAFEKVLLIGEGDAVTLGAPTVAGASVSATLVETRKGKKIKVFKKIRRQGYRRTRGHRQWHSVLRVTAMAGGGKSEAWDGAVDLTPLSVLNARARNLARGMEAAEQAARAKQPEPPAKPPTKTPVKPASAAAPKSATKKTTAAKTAKPAAPDKAAADPKAKPAKTEPAKAKTSKAATSKATASKAAKPAPAKAKGKPAATKKVPKKS